MTCRGFQYEVGHTYEFDDEPIPCKQGFHFCKAISDCYDFYKTSDDTRICKVEAIGDIKTVDEKKYCTNKIKIIREITEEHERRGNSNATSTGFCNTGNRNTGNRNTGDCNTGDCNTGDRNTGDCNTGDCNTGYFNTGHYNTGHYNTGNFNTGDRNTGDRNTGHYNTGYFNTGYFNTGHYNTGYFNTGDWNTTAFETGCFNTAQSPLRLFNKESNWTHDTWIRSDAQKLLNRITHNVVEWIPSNIMSETEKEEHPDHKTTGGYLKILDESDCAQIWWDGLSEDDRDIIRALPNFDEDIFAECVGINI